ncbi:MAG: hypothetical protein OSB41_07305 [Kiritimatiellae bacterium]|nr:hypothetical protein [Kiritimatiellia bacterium]
MEELPPRIVVREASRRKGLPSPKGPITAVAESNSALTGVNDVSEFPILEAFHEYLNQERARLRRKIVWMSSIFATLLIVLSGAAYFLGSAWTASMRADVNRIDMAAATDRADAQKTLTEQNQRLVSAGEQFGELRTALSSESSQRDKQSKLLNTNMAGYADDIDALRALVAKVDSEKRALASQLDEMVKILPTLTNRIEMLVQAESRRDVIGAGSSGHNGGPSFAPYQGKKWISMLILPPEKSTPVRWRQPLPE